MHERTFATRPLDPALLNFRHLPDEAIARVPTVAALFGVSTATVWRWTREGTLPTPVRIVGVTGWRCGDLRRILSQQGA